MSGQTTQEQLRRLLAQGKNEKTHWLSEDTPPATLAETLAAMANSNGGEILIGVGPRSGQIHGVHNPPEVIDYVFQAAIELEPVLVLPVPRLVEMPEGTVAWVQIPAGLPAVYNLHGRYLGRDGAHTVPLSARRLRSLFVERGVILFESQTPEEVTLDDLVEEQVEAYFASLTLPLRVTREDWLVQRGCLVRRGKTLRPTYAGLLLFGKFPQRWLPSAQILAVRFGGVTYADHFVRQEINGSLPDQLHQAIAFLLENTPRMANINGLVRQDALEYPAEAMREILVNAVGHRDYNMQGDVIHLNLFADRLEIHSPGGLPGPMRLDNLLQARFSRNPVIMQVLSDMGFVERIGYGLDRVVKVMRENRLPPPLFEELGGSFRVTLRSDGRQLPPIHVQDIPGDLNQRQETLLRFLLENKRVTNHEYQQLCPDVHPETLRRDLAGLVQDGVLLKIGDKRATYYVLKQRPGRSKGGD